MSSRHKIGTRRKGRPKNRGGFFNPLQSPLENIVVKIVDLDREIDSRIDELVDLKAELWELLGNIADERYRNVLWMRYAENKTMRQIAIAKNRTKRHIRRLHAQAIEEFRKIFEKYKNVPSMSS